MAPRAEAQPPTWDHYKVYTVGPRPTAGITVTLTDQFLTSDHLVSFRDALSNPVEKILIPPGTPNPIHDARLHYTWWRIDDQPIDRLVLASNQFGDQTLHLSTAQWLLLPALKNEQGPLPVANHYKCYACEGNPVDLPIRMIDQFGTWDATVTIPRYFCTPVEKRLPAAVFPIVDDLQHYVVYEFAPPGPGSAAVTILDQFFPVQGVGVFQSNLIMVPTMKTDVTSVRPSTWGRMKALYR
jgi:hypothetical protein